MKTFVYINLLCHDYVSIALYLNTITIFYTLHRLEHVATATRRVNPVREYVYRYAYKPVPFMYITGKHSKSLKGPLFLIVTVNNNTCNTMYIYIYNYPYRSTLRVYCTLCTVYGLSLFSPRLVEICRQVAICFAY